ncbi:hypothetical protein [Thalassotalea sp. PS06]|uniref:hypothetical protein n=1 Tax=Thalassotalea sp. PS06 TaxID=2594005 RepID=UPI001163EF47|nr:hypothetical protein [Thalassotalea sp. PS06]QDP00851.1 hypothetical protein FNC98_05505 [Thalassotalea sp. PS06]
MNKILTLLTIMSVSLYSIADENFDRESYYETPEFQRSPDENVLGMVYICAELSSADGHADDFEELLEKFRIASKISAEHSIKIRRDAQRWWARKPQDINYDFFWKKMCKEPTKNMRQYFSSVQ